MKTLALVLFVLMYVLMIAKPKYRPAYALTLALVFLVSGILPVRNLLSTINWNVLMMITGTMVIVHYFIASQMPNRLAEILLGKSKNVMWVTILMSLFSGLISAFIDNVATVLIVAPVGIAVCKKLKMNPVGMILSIAVSSNLQGAATLVGDTTSIMLGDYANMNFMDFFWMKGRPGIFFAVELGALATVPIMMFLFRKDKEPVSSDENTPVKDLLPTYMLLIMVLALITASFIPNTPETINGIICCALAVITVAADFIRSKKADGAAAAVRNLDFETLLLLLGLFVVIGGLTNVGIIDDFAGLIVKYGGSNIFLLYTIVVWSSVLISAFIDNIPYVATMLPVLAAVTSAMGIEPYLLYFGLLSGATLGGNITPIGASANITAVGMLKKEGHKVSFGDFMRIGIPYTFAAVLTGYLYLWIVWS
ncbi:MAG: TRAP transporter large permease subunit [Clostridia bacterium]|nr:TRAP transporter large permease subunit [Clostridia bacterium]MBR5985258.1 TRAP transporter large permease subunit [Clostridia bacterium]